MSQDIRSTSTRKEPVRASDNKKSVKENNGKSDIKEHDLALFSSLVNMGGQPVQSLSLLSSRSVDQVGGKPSSKPQLVSDTDQELQTTSIAQMSSQLVKELQKNNSTQMMKFSIEFSGSRYVDVFAHEFHDQWNMSLTVKDLELKKKLERSRRQLAESIRRDLGKKVVLDVE